MKTKRIKLGSGAHLLPFHHPAELAHRVAYLDHLSQGRFLFGVGASGLPSDLGAVRRGRQQRRASGHDP